MRQALKTVGFLVLVAATSASAQVVEDLDPTLIPRVDRSHCLRAHQLVEDWIDAGSVDAASVRVEPIEVSGAVGVRVTLRQMGLTVGRGQWSVDSASLRRPLVMDLGQAARQAAGEALRQVRSRMIEAKLQGALPPMLVDVQVALTPTPIDLAEEAPKDAMLRYFSPGYHGLVLLQPVDAAGRTQMAWMWPADAISRNMPADKQVLSLVLEVQAAPAVVDRIGRSGGPRLLRFEVIHVVRPDREQKPMHLVRGNRVLHISSLTTAELEAMCLRLADHLTRRQREDGLMAGVYQPASDQYDPADATPREQALAAYALARHLRLVQGQEHAPEQGKAEEAVTNATTYLGKTLLADGRREDVPATALALLAVIEAPHMAANKTLRDALAARILSRQNANGAFRADRAENAQLLHRADQAMIMLALVNLYEATRVQELVVRLRAAAAWQNREGPTGDLATLPWLIPARGGLDALIDEPWADPPPATELIRPLNALHERQLLAPIEGGPADIVGGIDLRTDRSVPGFVEPDWRTSYGLALVATALRRPDLPKDQALGVTRMELLLSCGMMARYLNQLMFDEPACFYVRSKADALDGVRRTLANNLVDTAATAQTLLAATELRATLVMLAMAEKQGL